MSLEAQHLFQLTKQKRSLNIRNNVQKDSRKHPQRVYAAVRVAGETDGVASFFSAI